jgi:hypothetical protein
VELERLEFKVVVDDTAVCRPRRRGKLALPRRDDYPACQYERAPNYDWKRRPSCEYHQIDDLSDYEERSDISSDQSTPVEGAKIQGKAVAVENRCPGQHQQNAPRERMRPQPDSDNGISDSFKRRSQNKKAERN